MDGLNLSSFVMLSCISKVSVLLLTMIASKKLSFENKFLIGTATEC